MASNQPLNIGTDRQLFVDDFWIAESKDTTRVLHEPMRREPVIEKDYPWEQGHLGGATVAYDGEKYRMWYKCDDASIIGAYGTASNAKKHAHAESDDGISWTKPFLGQVEFEGSKENNLLDPTPGVVGIDKNPDAKKEERFKAFKATGRLESAILAMASPDGINWHQMREEPILTGRPFDTKNLFFWDEWTGQYRGYTRGVANNDPDIDPATVKSQVGHEFLGGVRWIRWRT